MTGTGGIPLQGNWKDPIKNRKGTGSDSPTNQRRYVYFPPIRELLSLCVHLI
jgi:hypothetical protein